MKDPVRRTNDRSSPPPPGKIRSWRFPPFVRRQIANGLTLLAAPLTRYPLVTMELLVPAGGECNPPSRPGLASLHGGLLDEGTERRSAMEIANAIEQLGGAFDSGADWDCAYVATELLAVHIEAGLDLLAEVIREASFPEREVERLRGQRLAEILRRKDHPSSLAEQFFAQTVYGETVYGQPLIGTEESLPGLTREEMADFYRRRVGPHESVLIAVGDLDPDHLERRVGEVLGDWQPQPSVHRPVVDPPPLPRTRVTIVDRPGSAQTELRLGHTGIFRNQPDQPQALVLNCIYGGKFTSRINLNLREKHGYTYGAHSQFYYRRGRGPFIIRAAVGTEVAGAAAGEIVAELRRIRDEPVPLEDLRESQDYMIGAFPSTVQTTGDVVKRLEILALFDLPDDHYEHYPAVVGEVTREEVAVAARTYFHPDRLAIVAVGPADQLRAQFESFGPVTVVTS